MDDFIVIVISLILSAFFSGLEIAFITSNRLQVELDATQGSAYSKLTSKFFKNPSRFIATLLVGNNIALVVFAIFMEKVLQTPLNLIGNTFAILIVQTLISTIIVLFIAEYLPKSLFRIAPNKTLNIFSFPLSIVYYGLYFFVSFIIWISKGCLRVFFKVELEEDETVFGKVDLDQYIRQYTDKVEKTEDIEHEIQIFKNALDFSSVKVRECMVPRTEIVAVEDQTEIDVLRQTFIQTGLSKILVYRDTIDNIIGYVDSFEMFKKPEKLLQILRPLVVAPESMSADELLSEFKRKKRSIAVIVDEFGGTAGIVTIEDIIEEIFGEIEDEHDNPLLTEVKINDNEYLLSARLEIDSLNEKYKINLPESDDYETIGGLIVSEYQSIPESGTSLNIREFNFVIEKASGTKIDLVRLFIQED